MEKTTELTRFHSSIKSITSIIRILVIAVIGSVGAGCSDGDQGERSANNPGATTAGSLAVGPLSVDLKAASSLDLASARPQGDAAVATGTLAVNVGLALVPAAPTFSTVVNPSTSFSEVLTSIVSGPPEQFTITLKTMSIDCYEPSGDTCPENSPNVELLNSELGIPLNVEKATVDLSQLLQAAATQYQEKSGKADNSSIPTFAVSVGKYNRVKIQFLKKAKIKGCVSGTFRDYTARYFETSSAGDRYSNSQTYCTKTAESIYAYQAGASIYDRIIAVNGGNGELMDFSMDYPHKWYESGAPEDSETWDVEYSLPNPVEVKEGETSELSFLLDLNRLLRFESSAKTMDEAFSTDGSTPTIPSYFFDSTFKSASFAFIGKPGRIYGYELQVWNCDTSSNNVADDCKNNSNNPSWKNLSVWLTIVTDAQGLPLLANFMPTDDNTLTVIKGRSYGTLDNWIRVNDDGTANLSYFLDSADENVAFGTVFNFPVNLEATSVNAQIPGFLPYEVTDPSSSNKQSKGYVKITRKL